MIKPLYLYTTSKLNLDSAHNIQIRLYRTAAIWKRQEGMNYVVKTKLSVFRVTLAAVRELSRIQINETSKLDQHTQKHSKWIRKWIFLGQ